MAITIPRSPQKANTNGYNEFVEALEIAYNLQDVPAGQLQWVDVEPLSYGQPRVVAHIADNHPDLAVILKPENEKGPIMSSFEEYHAPLLVTDVNRWGIQDLALKNYKLDRLRGVPGPETMLPESRTLAEVVEKHLSGEIKDTTPVVELVSLLPMAQNGEFQTQFIPHIRTGIAGHRHYKIGVIAENSFSRYSLLANGKDILIGDVDEHQQIHNWMGTAIPDLSEMEQLMLPSSRGHMILIATPFEDPTPQYDLDSRGFGFRSMSKGSSDMPGGGDVFRSARVSEVSIGRGSRTGKAGLYQGEINSSRKGNAVIYHIKFLGITPQVARTMDASSIEAIGKSIRNYKTN